MQRLPRLDQGINCQTECLLQGERICGRHREIDAIDTERASGPGQFEPAIGVRPDIGPPGAQVRV